MIECLTFCNYVGNYFVITLLGLNLLIVTVYKLLIIINKIHRLISKDGLNMCLYVRATLTSQIGFVRLC